LARSEHPIKVTLEAGVQPALHFGGGQFSWNFIRWCVYSALVQLR